MACIIGIDIGGTSADAVCLQNGRIVKTVEIPVRNSLKDTLHALWDVFTPAEFENLNRLSLSSTLVTNCVAKKRFKPTGAIVLTGDGLIQDFSDFPFPVVPIRGGVDFRGRIFRKFDTDEARRAAEILTLKKIKKVAVIGKFSCRNPLQEDEVVHFLSGRHPELEWSAGHKIYNGLGLPRRILASCITLAIRDEVTEFADEVMRQVAGLKPSCAVSLLKADGGTIPLNQAAVHPLDLMFSGPAASAMGCRALFDSNASVIFMDIGGSTTDLGLIQDGSPLTSTIGSFFHHWHLPIPVITSVSIEIGGDTPLKWSDGSVGFDLSIDATPACLGGEHATLSDAACWLGLSTKGDRSAAGEAIDRSFRTSGLSVDTAARLAVERYQELIAAGFLHLRVIREQEPASRIRDFKLHQRPFPDTLIVLGGGGAMLHPILNGFSGIRPIIPALGHLASALGTAAARPTFSLTIHADTDSRFFTIEENGTYHEIPDPDQFHLDRLRSIANQMARQMARERHLPDTSDLQEIYAEQFNRLNAQGRSDRVIELKLQYPAGLSDDYQKQI